MSARPCRACGMPIEFHPAPSGKPMPVQRLHQVYKLVDGVLVSEPTRGFLVSHFETCPSASTFSKPKPKP